jgi:hypothetical protein
VVGWVDSLNLARHRLVPLGQTLGEEDEIAAPAHGAPASD